jgi:hypothetical protein
MRTILTVICTLFFTAQVHADILELVMQAHVRAPLNLRGPITGVETVSTNIGAGLLITASSGVGPLRCIVPKIVASNLGYSLGELHGMLSNARVPSNEVVKCFGHELESSADPRAIGTTADSVAIKTTVN